jgi:hypothetical protein
MNVLRGAQTAYKQIESDPWALATAGVGVIMASLWTEVIFDAENVAEPAGELLSAGFTLAAVALGAKAVRNYRSSRQPE